jgi:uncharacterized OsmC-like protein
MSQQGNDGPHVFTVDTHWTGGIRTSTTARGHEVVADGPCWRYGTDDGPAPGELLLASVGACLVNHMVRYLQFKRVILNGVDVKVTGLFRLEAELEVFDRFIFDVRATGPSRVQQVVEKAFKVAQGECTLLMVIDVEKEFNLSFDPTD